MARGVGSAVPRVWVLPFLLAWSACDQGPSPATIAPPPPAPSSSSSPSSSPSLQPLPTASAPVLRAIAPGAHHGYRVELTVGAFVRVGVEQQNTDIVLSLEDPTGVTLLTIDGPTADFGREALAFIAQRTGPHLVWVRAFPGGSGGHYAVLGETKAVATSAQQARAEASAALAMGDARAEQNNPTALDEAVVAYHQALKGWRVVDDLRGQATALHRLALTETRRHRFADAIAAGSEAADLFEQLDQPALAAMAWHAVGRGHYFAGALSKGAAIYERALPLRAEGGDTHGEAITAINLGLAYRYLGRPRQALDAYQRALARLTELDEPRTTATVFHNLGTLHRALGNYERAYDRLTDALRARRALGDPSRTAATLDQLGRVAEARNDERAALGWFNEALNLATEAGDTFGQAVVETRLGRLWQRQGRPDRAQQAFERALPVMRDRNDRRSEAQILQFLGALALDRDRPHEALEPLHMALDLHRQHGELASEAETWIAIARAERQQDRLDQAWSAVRSAVEIFESVRGQASMDARRATYAATASVRDAHTLEIDLAMQRHQNAPSAGWDERALEASERSRARWLLDLVTATGAELRAGVDPALLAREHDLLASLNQAPDPREQSAEDATTHKLARAAAERQFRDHLEALTRVRESIRAQDHADSGDGVGTLQPRSRTLKELRGQLLDADTALIEIALSEPTSHLWVLRPNQLYSFALPAKTDIEALATQAHNLLRRGRHRESHAASQAALCALSRQILTPAADVLDVHRLLIVADGVLRTLPFAALPHPAQLDDCTTAPPLVASHELIQMPSASVATLLRQRRKNRAPAPLTAAIIADSVTNTHDPRLPPSVAAHVVRREVARFRRLPHARQEAASIQRRVPAGETLLALGFDANRAAVQHGDLAGYRLLHFATHAIVDPKQAQHAGILLSTFDRRGRSIDGWLRPHEIYTLDLNANLVVLSACQTGLGPAVAGEGLVGLTYGFFHAGATQLLVSLWPVDDQATSLLMDHFYQALLLDQQPASAALRHAQRTLREQRTWSSPYHWAGFILQGDWR